MRYRNTKQKEIILSTIRSLFHPTLHEISDAVKQKDTSIGVSTIYRNLNQMVDQGMIQKIVLPNQETHYDSTVTPHNHFQCVDCGKLIDLDFDPYPDVTHYLKEKENLEIITHATLFQGRCEHCHQPQESQKESVSN